MTLGSRRPMIRRLWQSYVGLVMAFGRSLMTGPVIMTIVLFGCDQGERQAQETPNVETGAAARVEGAAPQDTARRTVSLEALVERMARARGEFNYSPDGLLLFTGDETVFNSFEGDSAVVHLVQCLDQAEPARATYQGSPVAVGYMCYVALTRISYSTYHEDVDDPASWPGYLEPNATAEDLRAAQAAWEEVLEAGAYRLTFVVGVLRTTRA